jgi:ABC-type dipeptide/oligopeptide/nickel transport system permease component
MGKRPITLKDIILQRIFISFLFIFLVLLFINILQSSVLNPIYLLSHLSINKESLEFFKKELLMDKNFLVRTLYDLNLYNLYTRLSTVYGEPVGKVIFKYLPQTLLIITVSVISFILYSLFWYKLVTVLEEKNFHILKRLSSVLVFLYSVPGFLVLIRFPSL